MICNLFSEPIYFLFTSGVPTLLYYAYIPTTILTFFVGVYVFRNGEHSLLNRLFLTITTLLSIWTTSTLIEWTNIHSDLILFLWSFYNLILGLLAIFFIYFFYVFLNKKDISVRLKVFFLVLLAPVLIISPTSLNLSGFNITTCDAFEFEWTPLVLYCASLGVLAMIWIFVLLIRKYRTSIPDLKKQISLMGTGIEAFLFLFFIWTNLTYYLSEIGALPDSQLEMYGMFGIVVFIIYISILMVRFKAFSTKTFGAQVLIFALIALIGSQFFYATNIPSIIVTSVTLVVTGVIGINLMRSVKKEIEQRERIEKVEKDLEAANAHLKELDVQKTEFISFATHQLRGPLTAVKGYASLLIEGDYGEMTDQVKGAVKVIYESTQSLLLIVGDYLNVSRMEQGRMKYDIAEFDLRALVDDTVKELSPNVSYAGLTLNFENSKETCLVNADKGKIKEVISNLIDNATKYTKKGGISIKLEKVGAEKCRISVSDNGIGIPKEVMPKLFEKFSRAEDASKTNIMGTGLGLYVAKSIIEQHKGRIWAESEGEGKGSTFTVELKLLNKDDHIPEIVKKFPEGL